MSAAYVSMVIDQGTDWTTEIVWTDNYDEPVNIVHPCRMEISSLTGQVQAQLETDPDLPLGETPSINLSSELGIIQLHLPATQTAIFVPGVYHYDLFVTMDDNIDNTGTQITRLLYGDVTVNKRVTVM